MESEPAEYKALKGVAEIKATLHRVFSFSRYSNIFEYLTASEPPP
jgi:hypothetical protein